jgi:calcineurin-like phosphoesterase family protein
MGTFFTSDTHFGHKNIITFDNRPFKDIDEHDTTLIANWNKAVSNQDTVYFLGDFALCNPNRMNNIMYQLNGIKYFIKGNHDKKPTIALYCNVGVYLGNLEEIKIGSQRIVLCHYAMRVWNKSHHGSWHLHGHSHHNLSDDPNSLSIDVGINGYDYNPISFEQVSEIMSKKVYKPKDHHGL